MRLPFWRKPRQVPIDLSASDEATAARKRMEANWERVHDEARRQAEAAARARRVLVENHFTARARHALEGR